MTARNIEKDFDLTCWYLNVRRVAELTRIGRADISALASISSIDEQMQKLWVLSYFKERINEWVRMANPPSLGQLIASDKLQTNSIFTHYSNFYFKGLPKVNAAVEKHAAKIPVAEAVSKLDEFKSGWKLHFSFSHEHLTSSSSWTELSGQARVLVIGLIKDVEGSTIEAVPYVIAYPLIDLFDFDRSSFVGSRWNWYLETYIEQIDAFSRVSEFGRPRTKKSLEALRSIPELKVKEAFAEVIGEPSVPKDWGGERSDLFSANVTIGGKRISTAFAFKGPAKFHPMTVADLGKNGDQIDRLFSEPADLVVLQHCHEITNPVRGMMRAYAQRMGQLKSFCIIDGYDTLRILGAYGKCGIVPPHTS